MGKGEPELVLKPSIHDFDHESLIEWLEGIRFRRLSAAMEFHANKNAKIAHEQDKIQRKFQHEVLMLEKEIGSVDKAIEKLDNRLARIEMLKQEMGLLVEQLTDPNPDTQDADEDD